MSLITANRYHDISCGHRVYGHENKCAKLHGHNYRFHFKVAARQGLDDIGRVIDFSMIKEILCDWLERNYDHKTLLWLHDPLCDVLESADPESVVRVPFNPTAENIAEHFLKNIAPQLLLNTNVELVELTIEETRKCSVTINL